MSDDETHECPAPGCSERVPFERLACDTHWRQVPRLVRARLTRLWSVDFGSDPYFEARADCLRAMGVPKAKVASLNGGTG